MYDLKVSITDDLNVLRLVRDDILLAMQKVAVNISYGPAKYERMKALMKIAETIEEYIIESPDELA